MANLLIHECLPLIQAMQKGVLTVGLWDSLKAYGQADSQKPNRASQSIYCNYYGGADFQESILKATPELPQSISSILIASYQNSFLDYALEDIEKAICETTDPEIQKECLARLLVKYEQCTTSEICSGCLDREFSLLLSQAEAQKASTVELTQIGDSFLEVNFIGETSISFKRPTHSLVYSTMLQKLSESNNNDGVMRIGEKQYQIKKCNLASFTISINNKEVLQVVFRGINSQNHCMNQTLVRD